MGTAGWQAYTVLHCKDPVKGVYERYAVGLQFHEKQHGDWGASGKLLTELGAS